MADAKDALPLTRSTTIRDTSRAPGFTFAYRHQRRIAPRRLVVLMPAALRADTEPGKEAFIRWSWRDSWPHDDVMAFLDPVVAKYHADTGITGAWFAHADYDFLELLAGIVAQAADERGIAARSIVYYGSSLGGFSAIAAAALTPGSRAVAEIPQIALRDWIPAAIALLEEHVFECSLAEFEAQYPERVDVQARCEKAKHIPSFTLLTNYDESLRPSQEAFVAWAREHAPEQDIRLVVSAERSGHTIAPREEIVPYV